MSFVADDVRSVRVASGALRLCLSSCFSELRFSCFVLFIGCSSFGSWLIICYMLFDTWISCKIALPTLLPSVLYEREQVGVDRVRFSGRHAVREAFIGFQCP